MPVEMAMSGADKKQIFHLSEWVKLKLYDPSNAWVSKSVRAVIAPTLCAHVILGLPFLTHNKIVIDHDACTAIDKTTGFDLLNPKAASPSSTAKKETETILP
jgi:hypothetical protein